MIPDCSKIQSCLRVENNPTFLEGLKIRLELFWTEHVGIGKVYLTGL